MKAWIFGVVIVAVLVLGAVVFALKRGGPSIQVTTKPVTSGAIARQVLATGTLEATKNVEVGSQVSGTIQSLFADFNSIVKEGQVIARLDPALYASQLEAAKGQLVQAQAEASLAQTTLDDLRRKLARARELSAQDLINKADLDAADMSAQQAAADLKARQASIQSAQAGVKLAQVDLDRTIIKSPINGVVVSRNVDVGQTVAATLQSPILFTIADLRRMNLLTEVNEGEVGDVRRGSDVAFQVETLGPQTFHGTVADVRLLAYATQAAAVTTASTVTSTTGSTGSATSTASTGNASSASGSSGSTTTAPGAVTYTAVIDVQNDDGKLAPGGTAIITMSGGSRQGVVRLPNNALSFRPSPDMLERTGQKDMAATSPPSSGASGRKNVGRVWRFDANQFVPVDVVIGLSDDQWTEMLSGEVKPGDQLVTSVAPLAK